MRKQTEPALAPAPFANCGEFEQYLRSNPFSVLELAPDASRADAERAAARLLALLEIGNEKAAQVATPFGLAPRTAEAVRHALAELRDPVARVVRECWAHAAESIDRTAAEAAPPAWPGAEAALGWLRGRRRK